MCDRRQRHKNDAQSQNKNEHELSQYHIFTMSQMSVDSNKFENRQSAAVDFLEF